MNFVIADLETKMQTKCGQSAELQTRVAAMLSLSKEYSRPAQMEVLADISLTGSPAEA